MKRLLICLGVLFIVLRPFSAHTHNHTTKGVLDFSFVNNTGKTLYAFFVTETKDEDWGDDLLPEDLVENEDEVDVTFDDDDDGVEEALRRSKELDEHPEIALSHEEFMQSFAKYRRQ